MLVPCWRMPTASNPSFPLLGEGLRFLLSGLTLVLLATGVGACNGTTAVAGATDTAAGDVGADSATNPSITDGFQGEVKAADAVAATGVAKVCVSNADCASFGLKCFETNSVSGQGICTKACAGAADCPAASHCNPLAGGLVCTAARDCDPCVSAADCSVESPTCLQGKNGKGYCTHNCTIGDNSCAPGASCESFGPSLDDFACQPDYGSCTGGGEHCSPCKSPTDCAAGNQCYTAKSGERFCAKVCDPKAAAPGCPAGSGCSAATAGKGFCWKQVKDQLVATCAKGDKGYCDACTAHYECASNRCAEKNGKKFCAEPKACTGHQDCPYGNEATFCVPSQNGIGNICAPPISWHCQGYKACLGHACESNQVCDNGLCKAK